MAPATPGRAPEEVPCWTTPDAAPGFRESSHDLFSDEHVADPYPTLAELREYAPAVYMSRHDYWLLTARRRQDLTAGRLPPCGRGGQRQR